MVLGTLLQDLVGNLDLAIASRGFYDRYSRPCSHSSFVLFVPFVVDQHREGWRWFSLRCLPSSRLR
jgi:hypothetical protein